MSSLELEEKYPELKAIDPKSITGRVFCAFCSGPFPAELIKCPHCGAPAEKSLTRTIPPALTHTKTPKGSYDMA